MLPNRRSSPMDPVPSCQSCRFSDMNETKLSQDRVNNEVLSEL